MQIAPCRGRRASMRGDERTAADAFHSANAMGGTSVIIGGRRPTAARCAIASPAAVRAWLHALAV
jgi:trehalose 6-phosphate phosphatase